MSVPTSIRLDQQLQKEVELYLKKNQSVKFSQLVNLALRQFISTKQTIVLEPASDEEVMKAAKKISKKYNKMMTNLAK